MCLIIKNKPEKLIASKNIIIYKVLRVTRITNSLYSPYLNFKYELNKLYKLKGRIYPFFNNYHRNYIINEAFHSFTSKSAALIEKRSQCSYSGSRIIYKGIIPKGSVYYKGKFASFSSIASNQIIIKDIIVH